MVKTLLTFVLITFGFGALYAQEVESSNAGTTLFSVNVSPNPASSHIMFSANSAIDFHVKMVDVLGNTILDESISEGAGKVDISKYRNGVYFVTLDAEGVKPITRKLIIRH